jgi:hypothetical protein
MSEEQKFGTRRISMCLSVRGALRRLAESRSKKSEFTDDGRPLTRLEAIESLQDELVKGHETIPLGENCNNPCQHADKGCKGFDHGKNGGCPGYWITPESTAAS